MNAHGKNRLILVATAGLCGIALCSFAAASPAFSPVKSLLSAIDSVRRVSVVSRSFTHHEPTSPTQLDLRPPGKSPPPSSRGGDALELESAPFPSSIHHLDLGKADFDRDDRFEPPALGIDEAKFRVLSPVEILARRFHREGLPLARLWESKSALLSIGLNKRGKPGLWLIQKIH
jgi:hypothetical protein